MNLSPYTMRHTYASFALDAGVSIFELARLMGTSVKVIDGAYGHLVRDTFDRVRTALGEPEEPGDLDEGRRMMRRAPDANVDVLHGTEAGVEELDRESQPISSAGRAARVVQPRPRNDPDTSNGTLQGLWPTR